eukprot:CAMPEP_0116148336 /NCGR_PEP_ID=MMETSP0329-20121206/18303_1 /TAXON_ID=697910 /ORGANISM="Pseudo-nitzschia arenysensis, Strain B593" /LENGTH=958 /DNA_ID=CAMNT_0003644463 /DNA_START=369 /DNA_END=3245 /DNA_ORIENTATION=-
MNASANSGHDGRKDAHIGTPKRVDVSKFPPVSTPDYCPFSVEIEPSSSNSFDHLRLSTVNKSWTLAMRTTISGSSLMDQGDVDGDDADDEFPLNQIDADIGRALSQEKAPVGLIPISSDSESSSRDDSVEIDSDEEDEAGLLPAPPSTRGTGSSHLPCTLSPRLSRTPMRGERQKNSQQPDTPANPLNTLKVLNPGIPQGHSSHRHHKRQHSMSRPVGTPQRGDVNALATTNSNVGSTLAADCMCFAIEDVTQFFCPATPKSTTIDNTTQCPPEFDCFPAYDYGVTSSPSAIVGPFPSIQGFWVSPKNSPQPRSREALMLMNANLPRNRSHSQKRKHIRKLLAVWHGSEGLEMNNFGSRDDFFMVDKRQRRRKQSRLAQPKFCYDSDPEQEVLGRSRRRASLLSSKQQPKFKKFCPEPFTHLDTDEESSSDDDTSSYETAKCTPPPSQPATPRNSDPKMSFDFGKELSSMDEDIANDVSAECGKADPSRSTGKGHRRERSTTSLSTTGHSRFHTIRMSPEQVQEGSDSVASSDAYSSVSGSTGFNPASDIGNKKRQHPLPSYFQSYPTHWTEFQLLFSRNVDEESVKSHVHELSNVRFPLVWHPRALPPSAGCDTKTEGEGKGKTKSDLHCPTSVKIASLSSNASEESSSQQSSSSPKGTAFPISVQGAFEVGAHLEHMVVQPKFTWTPLAQPVRLSQDPEANHRDLFLSGSAPPQVELLSIIRVNKATAKNLDRNLYPYARLEKTCIVSTNDANHPTVVLEARSMQERDWLVFSLKLIVARLASIIITRDEDMLHEFFSPYSALMRLEEDEESNNRRETSEKSSSLHDHNRSSPSIEGSETPTASSCKAVVVVDNEGSNDFDFPEDANDQAETVDDDDSACASKIIDEEGIPVDDDVGFGTDDDDDIECAYQDRDDREIEDSIRARNSGAYAILKRSLSATSPLGEFDEPMPRTLSY